MPILNVSDLEERPKLRIYSYSTLRFFFQSDFRSEMDSNLVLGVQTGFIKILPKNIAPGFWSARMSVPMGLPIDAEGISDKNPHFFYKNLIF